MWPIDIAYSKGFGDTLEEVQGRLINVKAVLPLAESQEEEDLIARVWIVHVTGTPGIRVIVRKVKRR